MIDTLENRIEARTGFFAGRVTCRLTDHHLEIPNGTEVTRIAYGDLSSVRIARQGTRRVVLALATTNGRQLKMRLGSPSSEKAIKGFAGSLIRRVALIAPETPLLLGPSRRQRLAGWTGLTVSILILVAVGATLLTGGPIGPILLPLGIALVNLATVIPVLQAGRPRHGVVSAPPVNLF